MQFEVVLVSAITAAVVNLGFQVGFYFLIQRRTERREKAVAGIDRRLQDLEEKRFGRVEAGITHGATARKEIYEKMDALKASLVSVADCNRRSEDFRTALAELNGIVRRNQVELKDELASFSKDIRAQTADAAEKIAETGAITKLIASRLQIGLGDLPGKDKP